jgi:hypothetical protein
MYQGSTGGPPWSPQASHHGLHRRAAMASTHTPPTIRQGCSSPSAGAEQEGLPFRRWLPSPATMTRTRLLFSFLFRDPIALTVCIQGPDCFLFLYSTAQLIRDNQTASQLRNSQHIRSTKQEQKSELTIVKISIVEGRKTFSAAPGYQTRP